MCTPVFQLLLTSIKTVHKRVYTYAFHWLAMVKSPPAEDALLQLNKNSWKTPNSLFHVTLCRDLLFGTIGDIFLCRAKTMVYM